MNFPHVATLFPPASGREIRRLMRQHKTTIRELAKRTGFTLKLIRRVRENGTSTFLAGLDWWQAITGAKELDPRRKAQLAQYLRLREEEAAAMFRK